MSSQWDNAGFATAAQDVTVSFYHSLAVGVGF